MKIVISESLKQSEYKVLTPIDPEKYPVRSDLEGPIRLRSGKIVYYDPKEGKYYDAGSDFYMSQEEYDYHNNPREKSASKKKMKNPCWDGYEMIGTKKKKGKNVPNCVPKN